MNTVYFNILSQKYVISLNKYAFKYIIIIIIAQDKPTTLVYADVMSFKQNPQSHAGIQVNPPMEDRVEYAQLKDYSENIISTELTTSNSSDNPIGIQSVDHVHVHGILFCSYFLYSAIPDYIIMAQCHT